jgi:succinoglycan biosynthesis protein ExoA
MPASNGQPPELSVILPVRNEAAHIDRILGDLLDQSLTREFYEILVVDGMSEDRTPEMVRAQSEQHPHIRLLENPRYLSSAGRNIGARSARGQYLLYVDGHCRLPSRDLLQATLAAFRDGARCLSRPQTFLTEGATDFQKAAVQARNCWLGHHAGSHIYSQTTTLCSPVSAGCGYRHDLFQALGGFDERFDACEDLEFNWRIWRSGVQAVHDRRFNVCYRPRGSFGALFRQLFRYGFGRARMLRKHPASFSPPSCGLAVLSLLILGLPWVALALPAAWLVWAGLLLVYLALTLPVSIWLARQERPGRLASILASFVAIHFGAGLGFLSGLVGGPSFSHAPRKGKRSHAASPVRRS